MTWPGGFVIFLRGSEGRKWRSRFLAAVSNSACSTPPLGGASNIALIGLISNHHLKWWLLLRSEYGEIFLVTAIDKAGKLFENPKLKWQDLKFNFVV